MLLEHPFARPHGLVLIEDSLIEAMHQHKQMNSLACEAGGILLGYRRESHLHADKATMPAMGDVRGRHHFWRQDGSHQAAATTAWQQSNGKSDYIGEWHTHPEPHATPSSIDVSEWRKLCQFAQCPMIFVIIGTRSSWLGVGHNNDIRVATVLQSH